jgi:probable HAF family extracellular repeat protein
MSFKKIGFKSGAVSLPALLLALAGGFSFAGTAQAQTFTEAEPAPGNLDFSSIYALSGDGSTAVGYAYWAFNASYPTSWDENGVPTLVDTGGTTAVFSEARGVNFDGSVVVGFERDNGSKRAVNWVNGVKSLLQNGDSGGAEDVNDDGTIIVGYSDDASGSQQATWWEQGGAVRHLLEESIDESNWASAVSGNGAVIVGTAYNGMNQDARIWTWNGNDYDGADLQTLSNSADASAFDVSRDGTTAVGYDQDNGTSIYRPVKWNTDTLAVTQLDGEGQALAVNGDGSVIVGTDYTGLGQVAMRWTDNGVEILQDVLVGAGVDMTDWDLEEAVDVSDDGQTIVGRGRFDGYQRSWIMRNGGLVTPEDLMTSLASVGQVAAGADSFVAGLMTGTQEYALQHATDMASTPGPLGYAADPGANFPNIKRNNTAPRWRLFGYAEGYGSSEMDGGHGLGQFGASYLFADYSLVGASLGFGGSTTDMAFDGEAEFLGLSGTVFAAYAPPTGFQAVFTATAAGIDADIARGYMNGGGTTTSEGETDGFGAGASLRVGYAFDVSNATRLTPFGSATVTHVNLDGYTETTGPFPAVVEELEDTVVVGRLGAEVRHDLSQATWIWASAAWAHRDNDEGAEVTATATGLFGLTNAALTTAQDWAEVTGGISVGLDDGLSRFTASTTAYVPDEDISVAGRIGFSRAF